jgi:outer membrane biosynthesis protein TonB
MAYVGTLDDDREPLGKSFVASMALHASVVALLTVGSFVHGGSPEHWGDLETAGGVVSVNAVARIPMVARPGPVNPVANDTELQVPQPPPQPKPVPQKVKPPEPDAIPIKGRTTPLKKLSQADPSTGRYRPYTEPKTNQVYSNSGGAMVSPMMGVPGAGGAGIRGTSLGDRFGAYAALVQQRVTEKWNQQSLDPRLRIAPPSIFTFTILRDGTIKEIRLKTSSGNMALDQSGERALYDVGRVDPLPAGYDRDRAEIEYWFVLKR